jgi:hypothetical protein
MSTSAGRGSSGEARAVLLHIAGRRTLPIPPDLIVDGVLALPGPVLLRRVRSEVLTQLPARQDTVIPVELTERQRDAHDGLNQPIARLVSVAQRRALRPPEFASFRSMGGPLSRSEPVDGVSTLAAARHRGTGSAGTNSGRRPFRGTGGHECHFKETAEAF